MELHSNLSSTGFNLKKQNKQKNIQGLFDLIKAKRHYCAHYRDKTSKIAFVHCRSWSIAHEIGFRNADFQLVMIAIYYNIAFTFCWCWQHKRKCNVYNTGCCKGNHFASNQCCFIITKEDVTAGIRCHSVRNIWNTTKWYYVILLLNVVHIVIHIVSDTVFVCFLFFNTLFLSLFLLCNNLYIFILFTL